MANAADAAVDVDLLRTLHREMVRGRAIEDVVLGLCDARVFSGYYHPGRGQEAVPAAVCTQLRIDDFLFYAHRGLTYLTAKGMDPVEILGDFAGTIAGSTRGLGAGTVHCVDPSRGVMGQGGTLGSSFPLATGAALGFQLRGVASIAVGFFGDGAAARGTFLESAVAAVARRLPVVFVCENNGMAISATIEATQGVTSLVDRAAGMGLVAVSVDGTDVLEVHAAVAASVDHARSGAGPAFVEAITTRMLGHYVGDLEPYRSRQPGEVVDPIERAERLLEAHGVAADELAQTTSAARDEMIAALGVAQAAPTPGPDRLFEGVWA